MDAEKRLRSFIDRIERLEEEKENIMNDIKEVYANAKSNGFDVKAMKKIVALRKLDPSYREELEHILETYKRALGME